MKAFILGCGKFVYLIFTGEVIEVCVTSFQIVFNQPLLVSISYVASNLVHPVTTPNVR